MKFRDVISEAKLESAEKLNMDLEYYENMIMTMKERMRQLKYKHTKYAGSRDGELSSQYTPSQKDKFQDRINKYEEKIAEIRKSSINYEETG